MTFTVSVAEVVAENRNQLLSAHPSWTRVLLGEVSSILNGFPFASEKFSTSEGTPLIRIRDVLRGETGTYFQGDFDQSFLVQPGELLVGMDGDFNAAPWRGRVALLNQRVCKVSADPRYLDAAFLKNLLPGYLAAINASTSSITVKHLSSRTLAETPIALPPRAEQSRIATKLDELLSDLDAGTAALERARANLKRYRSAILTSAVQGRLSEPWRRANPDIESASRLLERILAERRHRWEDAQRAKYAERGQTPPKGWQDRYPEPVTPDTASLPELPEGWCWATIDQLAEVQGGIQKQPKRAPKNNAYPYLRVGNVLRGRLDLTRLEQFELFDGELERLRLQVNDLLIVEGNGSRTEIGRCALWRGEVTNCVHQNHIIRLRPCEVLSEYLLTYWNSTPGSQRIMERAASTSGLYTLSVQKVSELPVPLAPMVEQSEIVALVDQQLSVLDRNAEAIDVQLARAGRLRQAILKRAFEGRLVPQDPNDEPAEKLLERIRAERAAESQSAPTRRRRASAKPAS